MAGKNVPVPRTGGKHGLNLAAFTAFMRDQELQESTIESYAIGVRQFFDRYDVFSKGNAVSFKKALMDTHTASTVNVKLRAVTKYAEFLRVPEFTMKSLKIQQRLNLENVISREEFKRLSDGLLRDSRWKHYWIVQFLARTGARVSEIIRLKQDCLANGHQDMFSKGKMRRIHIPQKLIEECKAFFRHQDGGLLFVSQKGGQYTRHGIQRILDKSAARYGIRKEAMHPHSFRHFFAKEWLTRGGDIAMLRDMLGHSCLNTTGLYLQTTAAEKRAAIDAIMAW